ncbi:MAG: hypothetical protein P794_04830 [Epsilonproteobacteria bacterium (ex Lamellibrachia satsuma)]|nr:MAG: hypothetical protein P794_04830 [Epsilonproteobacteria bacterium (ex Lamellibrachia satsuma)]
MELPAIKIPQFELPFDIPVLLHPPIDHFLVALPVIVLLLELVNLVLKKRAIGITSFFLLLLTVVAAVAAYFTGSTDGKEAFPLLSEAAQGKLKAHKLLGTYLVMLSVVVLVFKLLSAMIKRGLMKALYLLLLVLFVAGILKQGKDGGELVYKYGVNVEKVQEIDSELDDVKEELEDLKEETKEAPVVQAVKEKAADVVEAAKEKTAEVKEKIEAKMNEVKKMVETPKEKAGSAEVAPAATTTQPEANSTH